ncbi:tyrosine-type recombinase/integrase [Enterococcus cecorum]|uniref:tyrosine-type recombinase/integrase n=1 Tax=Enterococcus cecorum TaxID=44008 RepID=UPI003265EAE2
MIFSQLDGSKISYEIASRQVRTIFNECGIDYRGTHTFRHTFASILLDEGEDLKVVQEVMRHSDISLTANLYGKLALKTKRRAVDEMAVKMAVKGLR